MGKNKKKPDAFCVYFYDDADASIVKAIAKSSNRSVANLLYSIFKEWIARNKFRLENGEIDEKKLNKYINCQQKAKAYYLAVQAITEEGGEE